MELRNLRKLIKIPDLAGLPNLETFKLDRCPCLEEIHPSIERLERLVCLSIRSCERLRMFPSVTRIKKLDTLVFSYCNKLAIISAIQQKGMDNLPYLHLDDSGKEVASCKEPCTNFFVSCWTCGCRSPPAVESPPHYNLNHRRLRFLHSALRKCDLTCCCLGDEEIGSDVWELPNLEELDLSENPLISRLNFRILRLPRLKWLKVSSCRGLVELSELPSSIAVVLADYCYSLESFGDISNRKWLWKVSLRGKNNFDRLRGDTLIHSMLQGNASEDHFISVALPHRFTIGFVSRLFRGSTFRLHLPDNWYNDFCGFLICIVTDASRPRINIIIKQEDLPIDLSKESDEAVEPIYRLKTMTCIGYVSFSSIRHTTLLTSSYNIISLDTDFGVFDGGIELLPRKSRINEVQITDCSEFWDKKIQDGELNTFTIQHCDSDSSIKIKWNPYSR